MTDDTPELKDDLKSKLTPEQYRITQQCGTERAFTGKYWDCHDDGVYRCVVLRQRAVPLRREVRLGQRLAELLAHARRRTRAPDRGHARHGMVRTEVALRAVRRAPRPPVRRRPAADRHALLHQLGVARPRPHLGAEITPQPTRAPALPVGCPPSSGFAWTITARPSTLFPVADSEMFVTVIS